MVIDSDENKDLEKNIKVKNSRPISVLYLNNNISKNV